MFQQDVGANMARYQCLAWLLCVLFLGDPAVCAESVTLSQEVRVEGTGTSLFSLSDGTNGDGSEVTNTGFYPTLKDDFRLEGPRPVETVHALSESLTYVWPDGKFLDDNTRSLDSFHVHAQTLVQAFGTGVVDQKSDTAEAEANSVATAELTYVPGALPATDPATKPFTQQTFGNPLEKFRYTLTWTVGRNWLSDHTKLTKESRVSIFDDTSFLLSVWPPKVEENFDKNVMRLSEVLTRPRRG